MSGSVKTFFTKNWPKKVLSILLAVIIWSLINKSLSTTKVISNIPVRVKNVPEKKALSQANLSHVLNKRAKVSLQGYKGSLDSLTAEDFEIVIDARDKPSQWSEKISKYHLRSTNPSVSLQQVNQASAEPIDVKITQLVTKKIPIIVTRSMGSAPVGYEFLNIWPTRLYMSVSGPEEVLEKLEKRGYSFTYNLSNIPEAELNVLLHDTSETQEGIISYPIPDTYKQIFLPELSSAPLKINDPRAKELRVYLLKDEFLPFPGKLPISLHVAPEALAKATANQLKIKTSTLVTRQKGIPVFAKSLMVKGVSKHFLAVVKNNVRLLVSVNDKDMTSITTSLQFINPRILEDDFVSYCLQNKVCKHLESMSPLLADDYLRNRFKTYMATMQLFHDKEHKVELIPMVENSMVVLHEHDYAW